MLLISYDLGGPDRDYEALHEAIKGEATSWWHHLESVWLIDTRSSMSEVRSRLAGVMDRNDKLLIINLDNNHWLTRNIKQTGNDWLQNNL